MKIPRPAILAVDGGNSKTDLALVSAGGELRALVHGPTISHQQVGLQAGAARLEELAVRAARDARLDPTHRPLADLAVLCLAGAGFPERRPGAGRRVQTRSTRPGRSSSATTASRACGPAPARVWGVAVIAGSGINCVGIAPDGRIAAFRPWETWPAIGVAARASGRRRFPPRSAGGTGAVRTPGSSAWSRSTSAFTGRSRLPTPCIGIGCPSRGCVSWRRWSSRPQAPAIHRSRDHRPAGGRGRRHGRRHDSEAPTGADRCRRGPGRRHHAHRDRLFYDRIEAAVRRVARRATIRRVAQRPVLGAALLGLDRIGGQ